MYAYISDITMYAVLFIITGLFVAMLLIGLQSQNSQFVRGGIPVSAVLNHWSHFFQSFAMSSDLFYGELEQTLKEHQMPHSIIARTKHKEGGMLSAAREYLRIKHGNIVFDVCASPFGRDFFISWWLYETAGTIRSLLKHTKVGNFLQARATKRTFYQIDEEDMFRSCVHECILETITRVTEGKAILKLTEADKEFKVGGL